MSNVLTAGFGYTGTSQDGDDNGTQQFIEQYRIWDEMHGMRETRVYQGIQR
jgi:hypothetical protein